MQYSNIILEKKDKVARITLNRPQALNALSPDLFLELEDAVKDIAKDKSIEVVVLTGAGRAFSAGNDIKGIASRQSSPATTRRRLQLDTLEAIENLEKPVIAAVNGYCLTGALELVTVCDMIIASENAVFGDTHARWGLTPTWGGSQRLPRLIGPMKAKEMVFTCDMLSAKDALQIGLDNKVVPADKLEEAIKDMVDKILANSAASIRIQKALINKGMRLDYASALKMAEAESPGMTEDGAARLQSFVNKTWDKSKATGNT